jgi:hypothetical protein
MQENQHAGLVQSLATSGVTAPTEGRQMMTGAGTLKIGQVEKRGNRQEGLNGKQVTTKKYIGGVADRRETSKGRRKRADAGVCIKAHPSSIGRHHGKCRS